MGSRFATAVAFSNAFGSGAFAPKSIGSLNGWSEPNRALIAFRAALPFIVKDYVNERLHAMNAYDGSVADVDMRLWRGAYRIDGLEIVKKGGRHPTPFLDSKRVDFSVEWHSLLQGSVVAEAHFYEPQLNLVQARSEKQEQLGNEENWHAKLEELFPFKFNTVEVHGGAITFRTAPSAGEQVDACGHARAVAVVGARECGVEVRVEALGAREPGAGVQ